MHFFLARRIWILLFLGFSSGLPLALTTSTLSAWYTSENMSLSSIGLLSLIGQPYVYKFLWAPLIDHYDPLRIGRRRSWMLLTQIGLIASLLVMSQLNPLSHPVLLAMMAVLVATLSATQDISISAYLTEAPKPEERGLASSFYVSSYRVAIMVSGALALVLAQYYGWHITYVSMALLMIVGVIATLITPEAPPSQKPMHRLRATLYHSFTAPFLELASRFGSGMLMLILGVILLYKLTDAFALSLSSVFFLRELHYSLATLGLVSKIFSTLAVITGGLAAGLWMRKISLFKALVAFGILQALANFTFVWLFYASHTTAHLAIAVFVENFFSGMGNTAFLAFLISLSSKEFAGTQFALLSAVSSMGRVYTGPLAASVVEHCGWPLFFTLSVLIGIVGVLTVFFIRKRILSMES